jgi:hypothetical protein
VKFTKWTNSGEMRHSVYLGLILKRCSDHETRQTWAEFNAKDHRTQIQEIGSLQNKVAALADPLPLRLILGQSTSTMDFTKLLHNGTPLVVDLSDLGTEPAALLGAIIINTLKQAAEQSKNPKPYRLFIDEFQTFGTGIIATILAESGKHELWLTLAHQFISQLGDKTRDAVLGNCSTIVSFRVGPNDAPIISDAIDWNADDLQDLGRGQARWRTLLHGKPTSVQLLQTEKARLATGYLAGNIRNTAANYARPRALVELGHQS